MLWACSWVAVTRRGVTEYSASTGYSTLEQRGSAACSHQNDTNILSSSESLSGSMWTFSSLKRLYSFRRLFYRCRHTSKCRLRGFNELGLRQFWQLFNICPAGQTHSHDGVYLWQFHTRKTLSMRRHQPVGPRGAQRRGFPFKRGKLHVAIIHVFLLFGTIVVAFKHTCLLVCLFVCFVLFFVARLRA